MQVNVESKIIDPLIVIQVIGELASAQMKFPAFNSQHEGLSIIQEEFEELKEAVFWSKKGGDPRAEAIQLAAMALRFLNDCPERTVNESP